MCVGLTLRIVPSQLSHMLKLTPRPVIADVMKFVVQRGLTGKRFLRLRNQDLIEMGINISCECNPSGLTISPYTERPAVLF